MQESAYQSSALKEILMAIKGDESLGVEGMVAAQARIEEKFTELERTVKALNDWKYAITLYLGVITSKKVWKFLFITTGIVVLIILSFKYGILTVWQYIKNMVL